MRMRSQQVAHEAEVLASLLALHELVDAVLVQLVACSLRHSRLPLALPVNQAGRVCFGTPGVPQCPALRGPARAVQST